MVCHSAEFVREILQEKPYVQRLSIHLTGQILELDCDDFSRLLRAIDAVEAGEPSTKTPGDFKETGLLAGYGHFHYRASDWASTNFAAAQGRPIGQSLDQTIDDLAERIIRSGVDPSLGIEDVMKKFTERLPKSTGDWVLYREGAAGREYLAIHSHTERGSEEEKALKALLDGI
ncbi:hypothetical protein FGA82_11730 [Pseudomonas fluorescens]|uniref:hypothetical protein n=1 Tax=Pseudomonas fluorescens TaxID=294 RepID=UPI00113031E5|nr:hypothetical protein [Pseudomonas fluorescens]TMU79698.1 hypothetical protein FGA82_11730 [Pseudomonas fluorescens]